MGQVQTLGRTVRCTVEYDAKGTPNLQLSSTRDIATVVAADKGEKSKPKITQLTMTIAQPTAANTAIKALHKSQLQPTFSSQQL